MAQAIRHCHNPYKHPSHQHENKGFSSKPTSFPKLQNRL